MRTLEPVEYYQRKAQRSFGEARADLYSSMAYRWKFYGVHPMCAECRRLCKVASAGGAFGFDCFDYLKKA